MPRTVPSYFSAQRTYTKGTLNAPWYAGKQPATAKRQPNVAQQSNSDALEMSPRHKEPRSRTSVDTKDALVTGTLERSPDGFLSPVRPFSPCQHHGEPPRHIFRGDGSVRLMPRYIKKYKMKMKQGRQFTEGCFEGNVCDPGEKMLFPPRRVQAFNAREQRRLMPRPWESALGDWRTRWAPS